MQSFGLRAANTWAENEEALQTRVPWGGGREDGTQIDYLLVSRTLNGDAMALGRRVFRSDHLSVWGAFICGHETFDGDLPTLANAPSSVNMLPLNLSTTMSYQAMPTSRAQPPQYWPTQRTSISFLPFPVRLIAGRDLTP